MKPESMCRQCGKPLRHKPGSGRPRMFCDSVCGSLHWRLEHRGRVKPATGSCKNCGREIVHDQHRGGRTRLHCSTDCRRAFDHMRKKARKALPQCSSKRLPG